MKVQACGFCGEPGHNRRTCRIKRLSFAEQWAFFIQRDWAGAVAKYCNPCEEQKFPNTLFIRKVAV